MVANEEHRKSIARSKKSAPVFLAKGGVGQLGNGQSSSSSSPGQASSGSGLGGVTGWLQHTQQHASEGRPLRDYCGKPGHWRNTCWSLNGYPSVWGKKPSGGKPGPGPWKQNWWKGKAQQQLQHQIGPARSSAAQGAQSPVGSGRLRPSPILPSRS
ncbi:hypothetical protein CDL15_Pgr009299 [Punica granatum]|nr:hypothetical protein CDL15_Pgr009299 [Punica granatum]